MDLALQLTTKKGSGSGGTSKGIHPPFKKEHKRMTKVKGKNIMGVDITRPNQELIIMRGIPSSGKSTKAKELVGEGIIHSTDDLIEETGDYLAFFEKMEETGDTSPHNDMHMKNFDNSKKSMSEGISPVIIDNCNIKPIEAKKYVKYALEIGFDEKNIKFVDLGNAHMSAKKLSERSVHGISKDVIENLNKSRKDIGELSVEKVLNAKEKSDISISGVILDDKSHNKLVSEFPDYILDGWEVHGEHMTIIFGQPLSKMGLEDDKGKEVELVVTHVGFTNMVVALKVEGYPSDNETPHITLAVNTEGGGEPRMANDIDNWKKLNNPIILKGKVLEIKHK